MSFARVPAEAVRALRVRVERFLRAHGVTGGEARADVDLDAINLAGFLLAALRYVGEEHPWLGRRGAIVDPLGPYREGISTDLLAALPPYDAPLTTDACIGALEKAVPFTIVDAPCGRRRSAPHAWPYDLYPWPEALADLTPDERGSVHGIVAEEGWALEPARRDEAFRAALPANDEPMSFVEIDAASARALAGFLFAGPKRREMHGAYGAQAEAFVRLLGDGARCFGLAGLDAGALEDPYAHGAAWSYYDDASGLGSWARTLVLVITDGERVACLDVLWDVTSE